MKIKQQIEVDKEKSIQSRLIKSMQMFFETEYLIDNLMPTMSQPLPNITDQDFKQFMEQPSFNQFRKYYCT